jgi:DNA-binding response OmpR family regulator
MPNKRVLIVDDDRRVVETIQGALVREGLDTIVAYDGETGLAMAEEMKPDMILLDVMMPKIDGYTVVRRLREAGVNIPILILSAQDTTTEKVMGLERGADDYITKPFDPLELRARVQAQFRRSDRLSPQVKATEAHRKLYAILFTDICGYSKIMQADEARGLALLKEHNRIIRSAIAAYGGIEANNTGDGFLATFESVVAAVACAQDIHANLRKWNDNSKNAAPLLIRIGVHLGDVAFTGGQPIGDSINIASRLQTSAPPGGIAISESVHGVVHKKLSITWQPMGAIPLKNITQAIMVFHAIPD